MNSEVNCVNLKVNQNKPLYSLDGAKKEFKTIKILVKQTLSGKSIVFNHPIAWRTLHYEKK